MLFHCSSPAPECRSNGGFSALHEKSRGKQGALEDVSGMEANVARLNAHFFLLCPLAHGEAISLPKNPWRARKGRTLSNFQIYPAACTMGQDDFLRRKGSFPEQQSFPCGFCVRKSERFLAKTGWGGWRESKLPVHKPVKKFLTGCHGEEGEAVNLLPLWSCAPSPRFREESFFCLFGMA